ncbi:MAG: class I SAM-dependent methyltransferase [Solirubrobacteraceae bacterium]
MAAPPTAEQIREVNTRYHDVAASEYDAKWGIDFGDIGRSQVLGKVRKLLGRHPGPFQHSLEIGSGTGYFTLNLMQEGIIEKATCTDISPGMLETLVGNANRLGLDVTTSPADAEGLPFADESFDLVLGHAVLHHIPNLQTAFREFHRVLKPGGVFFFAGEPSRVGDRIAAYPKRGASKLSPVWRRVMGAQPADHSHHGDRNGCPDDHSLEAFVDVHAFTPEDLAEFARAARFAYVKVRGEELLANWFGWANRTFEASATPESIPWAWRQYAYRGYLLLQKVDNRLLEPRFPARVFYNLMITGTKAT